MLCNDAWLAQPKQPHERLPNHGSAKLRKAQEITSFWGNSLGKSGVPPRIFICCSLRMGYPTHFGQMECLKLIASSKFPDAWWQNKGAAGKRGNCNRVFGTNSRRHFGKLLPQAKLYDSGDVICLWYKCSTWCCPQIWGCVSKKYYTNLQVAAPWVPYRWTNAFESQ